MDSHVTNTEIASRFSEIRFPRAYPKNDAELEAMNTAIVRLREGGLFIVDNRSEGQQKFGTANLFPNWETLKTTGKLS